MATQFDGTRTPAVGPFVQALVQFWYTAAHVAAARSRQNGPRWAEPLSRVLAREAQAHLARYEPQADFEDTPAVAIATLYVEMLYFTFKYGADLPVEAVVIDQGQLAEFFAGESRGSATSDDALQDLETVKGSIEKILDKMPKPIRKIFEALLEILKLTRGSF